MMEAKKKEEKPKEKSEDEKEDKAVENDGLTEKEKMKLRRELH